MIVLSHQSETPDVDDKLTDHAMDNESVLKMGRIIKLDDDLAEVIVDEAKIIDMEMVSEYHEWIQNNLSNPCMLLINKINPYTYTFEAQNEIASLDQIQAMAVVVYSHISEVTTRDLALFPREHEWYLHIFDSRHDALSWLEAQRK